MCLHMFGHIITNMVLHSHDNIIAYMPVHTYDHIYTMCEDSIIYSGIFVCTPVSICVYGCA